MSGRMSMLYNPTSNTITLHQGDAPEHDQPNENEPGEVNHSQHTKHAENQQRWETNQTLNHSWLRIQFFWFYWNTSILNQNIEVQFCQDFKSSLMTWNEGIVGRQNSVGYQNPIKSLMSLGCRSSHSLLPSGSTSIIQNVKLADNWAAAWMELSTCFNALRWSWVVRSITEPILELLLFVGQQGKELCMPTSSSGLWLVSAVQCLTGC